MSKKTPLTDEQLMALDTLIYHENLDEIIRNKDLAPNQTVGQIVAELKKTKGSGAMMSQKEWTQMLDYIAKDKTLSSMKINRKTYKSDKDGFKALLVTDPSGKRNNSVIFRGTASNYQWHDNFVPTKGVAFSPEQRKAVNYVMSLGQSDLIASGHSGGGMKAETTGYWLPPGVIKAAVSYDGQGVSDSFLESLTPQQKMYGRDKTTYVNEQRDIVSQLFGENKGKGQTKYFKKNTGDWVRLVDDPYKTAIDAIASGLFHKPNSFLDSKCVDGPDIRANLVGRVLNELTDAGLDGKPLADTIWPNGWSESYYYAVQCGNTVYLDYQKSRMDLLAQQYASLLTKYGGWLYYDLLKQYNANDSEVVEGAVIACDACNMLGTLQLPEGHGRTTRGKNVMLATDTTPGENIVFDEGAKCFSLLFQALAQEAYNMDTIIDAAVVKLIKDETSHDRIKKKLEANGPIAAQKMDELVEAAEDCIPDTGGNEWFVIDEDKMADDVSILLKKSALCCNNGGAITIELTGQI